MLVFISGGSASVKEEKKICLFLIAASGYTVLFDVNGGKSVVVKNAHFESLQVVIRCYPVVLCGAKNVKIHHC